MDRQSESEKVSLGNRVVEVTRALGTIDMDNLVREVSDGNGDAVWWGMLSARAFSAAVKARNKVEIVKAEAGRRWRSKREVAGEKYTVNSIQDDVTLDPEVRAAVEEHIEAEATAAILLAAKEGAVGKARTLERLSSLIGQEVAASQYPILRDRKSVK